MGEAAPSETPKFPIIHVLLPTGNRVDFHPKQNSKVSDIIEMIQNDDSIKKPDNRTICIIYRGRILDKNEDVLKIDTYDEFTLHVFFRAKPQDTKQEPLETELRGFDRLSRMSYSQEQIAEIRNNFHRLHGTSDASPEERIEVEEEWFPVIFNHENPLEDLRMYIPNLNLNHQNHDTDNIEQNTEDLENDDQPSISPLLKFLVGFMMGIMFGICAVLFILISQNDTPSFLGLFAGIISHYALKQFFGVNI
ncbi:DUF2407 C-terminal domain-containing protein [Histomonas meleagridis]|uniref:DUF2407 C-terminal domain-containing protein n=1 Tax=Histomonas meleagridis TaxID=135588 RepID=UPI00355976DB|nr:DUF2407 C-terminal domain-containing protein [Histomonas meleagridis]KAH0803668.1 DUF2407 C-terminal domain-containing protein [Histomonas meleagridis]